MKGGDDIAKQWVFQHAEQWVFQHAEQWVFQHAERWQCTATYQS